MNERKSKINYNKWGYYFLVPFIVIYVVFSLIPILSTVYYSFFEYFYKFGGLVKVGPNFALFDNYAQIFEGGKFFKYFGNTMILWIMGFVPQVIVSLILALWFTSTRLNIKAQGFFKAIIYVPNLVMASAFSLLFLRLFEANGPMTTLLFEMGWLEERISFANYNWSTRGLISLMNYLMWFGNTTILMMAGIMGIDRSVLESARMDGASTVQTLFLVILPLLKPIILFVMVTSLVGGVQMFDIPSIFTAGQGGPEAGSMTVMMYISQLLGVSKQYGLAGAASTVLFMMTALVSLTFFFIFYKDEVIKKKSKGVIDSE